MVPAGPDVPRAEAHAKPVEAPEPGPEHRRSLEAPRKDAAARPDEGRLAEFFAPGPQRSRREALESRPQMRGSAAIALQEGLEVFAVREIETASSRKQKLASDRGHAIEYRDRGAALRQDFGGHQPCRTGAHHGDLGIQYGPALNGSEEAGDRSWMMLGVAPGLTPDRLARGPRAAGAMVGTRTPGESSGRGEGIGAAAAPGTASPLGLAGSKVLALS